MNCRSRTSFRISTPTGTLRISSSISSVRTALRSLRRRCVPRRSRCTSRPCRDALAFPVRSAPVPTPQDPRWRDGCSRHSTLIIGLTIVGLGTSAPELAVSTAAALHGSNEIALSNVIGSNIFNLLFILGVSTLICPISINLASVCDLLLLLMNSALALIFCLTSRRLVRFEGIVMVFIYIAYVIFAVFRH